MTAGLIAFVAVCSSLTLTFLLYVNDELPPLLRRCKHDK